MLAIYKRELKAYFTSPMGYVFIAFLMCVVGIYFTMVSLNYGYGEFGQMLILYTTFIFLILVPILTMRVMAEERRQKTDQLLFTAPVRIIDIILGKYLALLTVFAIPMVIFCFYPLILMSFGKSASSLPTDYVGMLGYFLYGATTLAIGLFISSMTESQVLSAVLSFFVLLLFYVSASLASLIPSGADAALVTFTVLILIVGIIIYAMTKNIFLSAGAACVLEVILVAVYVVNGTLLEGAVTSFFNLFDITDRIYNFMYGILDLTGIVYYVSLIVLCLFLTVQSIQKRRWS